MKYMLDTNICIYLMREHPKDIIQKFNEAVVHHEVVVSSVVMSELYFGACKSTAKEKNIVALEKFSVPVAVCSYDKKAAYYYGEIRETLRKTGLLIGPMDLMIAAHALSAEAILITNNLKEFSRVKGLRCENWV